jgi:4-amino-4-deoxy-L-arabinose transferase-like glycosyltransferase
MASGDEGTVGESFMRVNWTDYARLFFASRLVALLFSLALAVLVWRWARALHGEAAGLLAVALYALSPEALAHAGIVGTDLPTALAFTLALFTLWRYLREPTLRAWSWMALAFAAAFLTRFSAVQLVPVFAAVTLLAHARGRLANPRRVWLGLLALAPVAWFAVIAGYRFALQAGPWSQLPFRSSRFLGFVHRFPGFGAPLPTAYLAGLDYMMMLNEQATTYLLGRVQQGSLWYYFPLALSFKLPLGTWGALVARATIRPSEADDRGVPAGWVMGIAAAILLVMALFFTRYNFGIRYLLPLLPLACIWCGGLLDASVQRPLRRTAVALALLLALESTLAAPWFLSFYNWPAGGPGGGDRLVNDSNVDWGQGLIALREEMAKRGIRRIHLSYQGTTDPAVYGIDYVPYLGGPVGPESEWIAVSSYYFVGLGQRMMTPHGRTDRIGIDFRPLWTRVPDARPAGCMYLFHLPGRR